MNFERAVEKIKDSQNRARKFGETKFTQTVSLCESCRAGFVAGGEKLDERVVFCHSIDRNIPFKVFDCKSYDDKSYPPIWAMQQIAWDLTTAKSGKPIGFKPPKDANQPPNY